MRTSISKENTLKSRVLFFTMSAFILSILLFTSCSESTLQETAVDDETLISQIENAATVVVDANSLPAATANALNGDLADSFVTSVAFAEDLGYKVSLTTYNEARAEKTSEVYFSKEGKKLTDTNEKRKKRRHKCFEFVFPIDFIMPDATSITLNSKDDWSLIKEWFEANPDTKERPEFVFPVNITLEDGTVQTLIDKDELKAVKDSCKKGKDKRKCFKLVLPVSFTMPDASVIDIAERKDFKLMREWHKANPDVKEKGSLNFPVDIFYRNQTTATINNETEMEAAKKSCK